MAQYLLDERVADGDCAGRRQIAERMTDKPDEGERSRPAALEAADLAQKPDRFEEDVKDVDEGARAKRGHNGHPAR